MLDLINRYGHGYIAIPVIVALRDEGFFRLLMLGEKSTTGITVSDLSRALKANAGHLSVALRLLISMEWIKQDKDALRLTPKGRNSFELIPKEL
mmetsp:Transcript_20703/g.31615  ORF Transcript_20703/g.31615 Transcript_20703/m.31615 type:complete len:94 (-) Transcript_20703:10-291(-)